MDSKVSLSADNSTATTTTATTSTTLSTVSGSADTNAAQRRRPTYFFRTADSLPDDGFSPRLEGRSYLSEGFQMLLWSVILNGLLALVVMWVVEGLLQPVLMAILELTPSPRTSKVLTALLTVGLLQGGGQGSIILLMALGISAVVVGMSQSDGAFVPCFLALLVCLGAVLREGGWNAYKNGSVASRSTWGDASPLSAASGVFKPFSGMGGAQEGGRRNLWGA